MFPLKNKIQGGYKFGQWTFYGRKHAGTDYQAVYENFVIPFNGYVKSGWGFEGGNFLELTRDNGDIITLRHLSKIYLTSGYRLEGEFAGITGNTGAFTTSPHLHIEVRIKGQLVDPEQYFAPRIIKVKVVRNGPDWVSMGSKYAEVLSRLKEASGGRLSINIDSDFIDYEIPLVNTYPMGRKGVDLNWYAQYITPKQKGYDVVCLLMDKIIDNGKTFGWHTQGRQIQVFAEELETVTSLEFGTMNVFVQALLHELCHCLNEMQETPDAVHAYLDNAKLPNGIFQLKEFLNTLNWDKIIK